MNGSQRAATPVIIALIALVMIKGMLFAAMLPAWEGDDETAYWADIRGSLGEPAVFKGAGATEHGRLYPLLAAPVYAAARPLSPAHRLLAVRLLGLALFAATVFFTYRCARRLWPNSTFVQIAAPFLVAFNPKLSFVMASTGSDVLLIFLFSAFLLLLTWVILEPTKPGAALLALVVLFGMLTKERFMIALPLLGLAMAALALEYLAKSPLYRAHRQKFWLAGAGFAAVLWEWRSQILALAGTGTGRNALAAFTLDRTVLGVWTQPWFRFRMFRQFWGFFSWHGGIYLGEPIYQVLFAMTAAAGLGLVIRAYRAGHSIVSAGEPGAGNSGLALNFKPIAPEQRRRALAIALYLLAIWTVLAATGAYELSGSAALGRYLLIGALPAALLMAAGLEVFFPSKYKIWGLLVLAGGGFWLNMVSISAFLMPRFY